ncbi:MAG: hypothetical protein JRI68_01810 [Deltaproteobacteria bacterium]|nr:hypothetical protein [Deltaproteobacteria bacterium]
MLRRCGPWLAAGLSLTVVGVWSCGGDSDLFSSGPGPSTSGGGATSSGSGGATSTSGGGGTSTSSSGGGSGGSGGAGGAGMGVGAPCTWGGSPCDQDLYCLAMGCGDGTCQPVVSETGQQQDLTPVCGCDGITYFNTSIAASFGMAVAHGEACTNSEWVLCHKDNSPCPAGYFCSRRVASVAGCILSPNQDGQCWAVQATCDPNGPKDNACGNSLCYPICELIKTENGWFHLGTCF